MEMLTEPQDTLRGLNERLRAFLQHVAQLQEVSDRLRAQITEWGSRNAPTSREWSSWERTAEELQVQIIQSLMENVELTLASDNMKSSVAQLRSRCEVEKTLRQRIEQQVLVLRERKTDTELANSFLKKELTSSGQELKTIQEDQQRQRELFLLQHQQAVVESDAELAKAAAGEDGKGMELPRISTQCERSGPAHRIPDSATHPNPAPGSRPAPQSHHRKATSSSNGETSPQVRRGDKTLRDARAELTEVRKRWHSLQVEIESLHALERGLQSSLLHTQHHYSLQLRELSRSVHDLEAELEGVRDGLAAQRQHHDQLLNTKMKLEREIATYRKLLEHEEGRFLGVDGQTQKLRPWRGSTHVLLQNGLCNGSEEEPILSKGGEICTVKKQEILEGNVVQESAEGHGRVETEKIDKVIRQWEGSFFKGNPKLRKKSVSLRFDLHMAVADEGCGQTKQDSLPDVEVRLVMKRSRSIHSITQ